MDAHNPRKRRSAARRSNPLGIAGDEERLRLHRELELLRAAGWKRARRSRAKVEQIERRLAKLDEVDPVTRAAALRDTPEGIRFLCAACRESAVLAVGCRIVPKRGVLCAGCAA